MKRRIVMILCCTLVGLSACSQTKPEQAPATAVETPSGGQEQQAQTEADAQAGQTEDTQAENTQDPAEDTQAGADAQQTDAAKADTITEDQALEAIRQYCFSNNPDLKEMAESDDYNIAWEVSTDDTGKIVVLFRSYTGSMNRYYIDPKTGETYGTEQVPGIIDEEQRTEESFNVRDYLGSASSAGDAAQRSDDGTVKGIVGHSTLEASFYVTETDNSVVGPEGAYTFSFKY